MASSSLSCVFFFSFLWLNFLHMLCAIISFLAYELWDTSYVVLGLIVVIHIQRAIYKFLIAMFLSCKFKHDEMNCAWWSGCWYGHGLGMYVMLQLAHNFIVKIIELLLWSSDGFLGHFLFMLTPLLLVPYINCIHVTMLCKYFYFSYSLHLTILINYFVLVWL